MGLMIKNVTHDKSKRIDTIDLGNIYLFFMTLNVKYPYTKKYKKGQIKRKCESENVYYKNFLDSYPEGEYFQICYPKDFSKKTFFKESSGMIIIEYSEWIKNAP